MKCYIIFILFLCTALHGMIQEEAIKFVAQKQHDGAKEVLKSLVALRDDAHYNTALHVIIGGYPNTKESKVKIARQLPKAVGFPYSEYDCQTIAKNYFGKRIYDPNHSTIDLLEDLAAILTNSRYRDEKLSAVILYNISVLFPLLQERFFSIGAALRAISDVLKQNAQETERHVICISEVTDRDYVSLCHDIHLNNGACPDDFHRITVDIPYCRAVIRHKGMVLLPNVDPIKRVQICDETKHAFRITDFQKPPQSPLRIMESYQSYQAYLDKKDQVREPMLRLPCMPLEADDETTTPNPCI